MNIDLSKPNLLPNDFVVALRAIKDLCKKYTFSEKLVEHKDVLPLVRSLDNFCMNGSIIGYHFTRAIKENIEKNGLLIRSGDEIRNGFICENGYLFTDKEQRFLQERWSRYFTPGQNNARDNKIFFNFTSSALRDGGAENLLGLYGGEQVGMCFEMGHPIGEKLANIGQPLVIRCALKPKELNTFIEYPWGKILVSSFHKTINSEAYIIDQDGYQFVPVSPNNIVDIAVLEVY
ncbi:MAG: hypothetical protein V7744_08900 [Pseudomonadales bacterium]